MAGWSSRRRGAGCWKTPYAEDDWTPALPHNVRRGPTALIEGVAASHSDMAPRKRRVPDKTSRCLDSRAGALLAGGRGDLFTRLPRPGSSSASGTLPRPNVWSRRRAARCGFEVGPSTSDWEHT